MASGSTFCMCSRDNAISSSAQSSLSSGQVTIWRNGKVLQAALQSVCPNLCSLDMHSDCAQQHAVAAAQCKWYPILMQVYARACVSVTVSVCETPSMCSNSVLYVWTRMSSLSRCTAMLGDHANPCYKTTVYTVWCRTTDDDTDMDPDSKGSRLAMAAHVVAMQRDSRADGPPNLHPATSGLSGMSITQTAHKGTSVLSQYSSRPSTTLHCSVRISMTIWSLV